MLERTVRIVPDRPDAAAAARVVVNPLVSVAELAASADDVTILDVRWRLGAPPTLDDYLAAHIPGARWADLDTVFAGPPGSGGRHPLPKPRSLQRALRALGLGDGDAVVVYDDADSTAAARAWWVLRWAGLRRVRVLRSGRRAHGPRGRVARRARRDAVPG